MVQTVRFPYGTAGFRAAAVDLDDVAFRCGIFAALLSNANKNGAVGCMITASHNPAEDNGVKIANSDGNMIPKRMESIVEIFVNCGCTDEGIKKAMVALEVHGMEGAKRPVFEHSKVLVGMDTRESSLRLLERCKDGIAHMGAKFVDLGVLTTPQLHFLALQVNLRGMNVATQSHYFDYFSQKFHELLPLCGSTTEEKCILVDGANGVGGIKMEGFVKSLREAGWCLEVRNRANEAAPHLTPVNLNCGSELVQKLRRPPTGFDGVPDGVACCSVDGDADRVVFFTFKNGQLALLEGDRLAMLFATVVIKIVDKICAEKPRAPGAPLSIGIVQTAYANGASTAYGSGLGSRAKDDDFNLEVACVPTGVKHLHGRAATFDIGIYFESNGHGTLVANFDRIEIWARGKGAERSDSYALLCCFLSLFNPTVGDAMVDVLAVVSSLRYLEWDMNDWILMYEDLPSHQEKIPVPRDSLGLMKPHPEHERTLLEPKLLQEKIDETCEAAHCGTRAFVRPSGTEEVARLYVESPAEDQLIPVAKTVKAAVLAHTSPQT